MVRIGDYIHSGCVMYTVGFPIIISEQVLCGFLGKPVLGCWNNGSDWLFVCILLGNEMIRWFE